MKVQRKKILEMLVKKRNYANVLVFSVMTVSLYLVLGLSTGVKNFTSLSEGVNTCFIRLNQTYTAGLIGSGLSDYLTTGFMNTTEECLSDTIVMMENLLTQKLKVTLKKLNNATANVHWFHEKIGRVSGANNVSADLLSNLTARFSIIESLKDNVLESIEQTKQGFDKTALLLKTSIYASIVLLIFLVGWSYLEQRQKNLVNATFEKDAFVVMQSNDLFSPTKVEEIIGSALKHNDLPNCQGLFNRYNSDLLGGKLNAFMLETYQEQDSDGLEIVPEPVVEDIIEPTAFLALEEVKVAEHVSVIVDMLASKIFTGGVAVEFNISENQLALSTKEGIQQVFYNVLSKSIERCTRLDRKRHINISTRELGGLLIVNIIDSGIGLSTEFLRSEMGLGQEEEMEDLDIMVAKGLMKEFGGNISFENTTDDKKQIIGSKVTLIFNRPKPKQTTLGKLISLKKGRKKDLLREFAQEAV
ncbi:MAG: HAMP domain-containing histidine kinase [Bacteriovoracaceae bacterium]|nr:HAMP domain-containing histidine kinase [Bacteriovoracaceae bacterium]